MSSGIKLMVLAVIVGIGSTIFGSITAAFTPGAITLEEAASVILASLSLLALGVFGPAIANGLVSGAPQLGAGAAVGTVAGVGAGALAGGAIARRRGESDCVRIARSCVLGCSARWRRPSGIFHGALAVWRWRFTRDRGRYFVGCIGRHRRRHVIYA